jgi:dGTPase
MPDLYKDTDKLRLIVKAESEYRTPFRRDNGRLIHCASFRRLQGKTQLFPTYESDFFRNRLTHSLEVAQIAKGIAEQLNHSEDFFKQEENKIDLDIVETAALAHDLGHPPFGHNGEEALDQKMKDCGGFEGNAQTLRILSKLEKKETFDSADGSFNQITTDGKDNRCGLNFAFRTLASVLKYDRCIPKVREKDAELVKGYYYTEKDLVEEIKAHVLNNTRAEKLYTIECQIMDLADDISYCTYDLEDALKSGFISPLGILTSSKELLERVAKKVRKHCKIDSFNAENVLASLNNIFKKGIKKGVEKVKLDWVDDEKGSFDKLVKFSGNSLFKINERLYTSGYYRTAHTSELVHNLMSSVIFELNNDEPALSKVMLDPKRKIDVEVLKHYNYEAVISSSRLRISEFRGQEIVAAIFDAIADQFSDLPDGFDLFADDFNSLGYAEQRKKLKGEGLLPEDSRKLYNSFKSLADKKRVICDFIAGMTDRYAIEFYGRLKSEHPQTIFKPL